MSDDAGIDDAGSQWCKKCGKGRFIVDGYWACFYCDARLVCAKPNPLHYDRREIRELTIDSGNLARRLRQLGDAAQRLAALGVKRGETT